MDESIGVIVSIRLEKAREDLEAVRQLINSGMYRIAISRAYYAVFGITTAALLTQGIERGKHSGVQSAFSHYFIKSGIIEPEYGKIYTLLRKARAEKFVARMERYLRGVGTIG